MADRANIDKTRAIMVGCFIAAAMVAGQCESEETKWTTPPILNLVDAYVTLNHAMNLPLARSLATAGVA